MAWFIIIGIVVYMAIYALEWAGNYVIVSPQILDEKNLAQINEQANEIAHLSFSRKQREKFAALMNEEYVLAGGLSCAVDNDAFSKRIPDLLDWVGRTIDALNEAGLETDAAAFSQSGTVPPSSTELLAFEHLQSWKRYQLAQLALYRKSLHEIIKRRDL